MSVVPRILGMVFLWMNPMRCHGDLGIPTPLGSQESGLCRQTPQGSTALSFPVPLELKYMQCPGVGSQDVTSQSRADDVRDQRRVECRPETSGLSGHESEGSSAEQLFLTSSLGSRFFENHPWTHLKAACACGWVMPACTYVSVFHSSQVHFPFYVC